MTTPSQTPTTCILIVNYRTAKLVVNCLRSLADEVAGQVGMRVMVADNASPDDSLVQLHQAVVDHNWENWVEIVAHPQNGGFAYGNNRLIAADRATGNPADFYLLLNPDTVVRAGAVRGLIDFATARPQVGIVGSRLEHPDGEPQRSMFRFHSILSELDDGMRWGFVTRCLKRRVVAPPVPNQACQTEWVSGACMLVRREVFEQVGMLDEGFFMYFEEVDLCRRARKCGWECWYQPASRVVHLVGQASGVQSQQPMLRRMPSYWFESRRRFFIKHRGWFYTAIADLAWMLGRMSWQLRARVQRKPQIDPPHLLTDFLRHSVWAGKR